MPLQQRKQNRDLGSQLLEHGVQAKITPAGANGAEQNLFTSFEAQRSLWTMGPESLCGADNTMRRHEDVVYLVGAGRATNCESNVGRDPGSHS